MMVVKLVLIALIVYITNQYHFPLDFSIKGLNVFNVLYFLGLAAVAVKFAAIRGPTPVPMRKTVYAYVIVLVLAFVNGLSSAYAEPGLDATYFKNMLFDPLLFLLFYHGSANPKTARQLIFITLFVAAVAMAEAVREGLSFGFANYNVSKRAAGPFGEWQNANKAGAYFALFIPIFGALSAARLKPHWRLAFLMLVGLGIMAVFFTYSRTAYFATAAGLIGLFMVRSRMMGVLFLVALINYTAWAPESVQERVASSGVTESGVEVSEQDESTQMRYTLWSGAFAMVGDYPLGVGLNHFKRRIGEYSTISGMDAHNFAVLMLAEGGWVAALIFVFLIVVAVNMGRQLWRKGDSIDSALGHGFVFGVAAFVMVNMFSTQFTFHPVAGSFWILAGLIARLLAEQRANDGPDAASDVTPATQSPFRQPRILVEGK